MTRKERVGLVILIFGVSIMAANENIGDIIHLGIDLSSPWRLSFLLGIDILLIGAGIFIGDIY